MKNTPNFHWKCLCNYRPYKIHGLIFNCISRNQYSVCKENLSQHSLSFISVFVGWECHDWRIFLNFWKLEICLCKRVDKYHVCKIESLWVFQFCCIRCCSFERGVRRQKYRSFGNGDDASLKMKAFCGWVQFPCV